MGLADMVIDNPILTKHLRARLRPARTAPWGGFVLVLSACAAWSGHFVGWSGDPWAVIVLVGLQILILAMGGVIQINASLGGARESGILDFHRVSPLPPGVVALGFFLGAPIREYALAAIVVPFAVYNACQVEAGNPWKGMFWLGQLEAAVLVGAWLMHAVSMLECLTRKKPRGAGVGAILAALLFFLLLYLGSFGLYFGSMWVLEEARVLNFFGFGVPWLAWVLLYAAPALGFLGLAITRKMNADRAHAYSKPEAIACMATLGFLTVGSLWNVARFLSPAGPAVPTPSDVIALAAVYGLSLAAIVLIFAVTPVAGEYIKGVRRANRAGQRRPSPWSDAGSNRVVVFVLGGLVLAAAASVVEVVGSRPHGVALSDPAWLSARRETLSRPIAIAVLTAAYVGLGLQYFLFRARQTGMTLFALFLFLVWLLPMLAGAIVGMSGPVERTRVLAILALSPVAGIALSSGLSDPDGIDLIRLAALAPPITFAFIFKFLLVRAQRRLDRSLQSHENTKAGPWSLVGIEQDHQENQGHADPRATRQDQEHRAASPQ